MKLFKICAFVLFIIAFMVICCNATTVTTGVVLSSSKLNISFNNSSDFDSIIVDQDEIDYGIDNKWSNVSTNSSSTVDINIDYWGLYSQRFNLISHSPGSSTAMYITGYVPGTHVNVNTATLTADSNGIITFVFSDSGYYTIGSPVSQMGVYQAVYPNTTLIFPIDISGYSNVSWYMNKALVTENTTLDGNTATLTYTFTKPGKFYNITAIPVYANGTNGTQYSFGVVVKRPLAKKHVTLLDTSAYDQLLNDFMDENTTGILNDSAQPYVGLIGWEMFWALIWSLPFLFSWLQSRRITISATLLMIFGCVVIWRMPSSLQTFIPGICAASIAYNLYKLTRSKY